MDANAIIFYASISVFDQYLEEDPHINCLEDSLKAWTTICKSTLLAKVPPPSYLLVLTKHADNGEMARVQVSLILILSGCDALEVKLKQGILLKNYIPSYGDRANDLSTVTRCMSDVCPYSSAIRDLTTHLHRADIREKFLAISRKASPEPRTVYVHLTTSTVRPFHPILLLKADWGGGYNERLFFRIQIRIL